MKHAVFLATAILLSLAGNVYADIMGPIECIVGLGILALIGLGVFIIWFGAFYILRFYIKKEEDETKKLKILTSLKNSIVFFLAIAVVVLLLIYLFSSGWHHGSYPEVCAMPAGMACSKAYLSSQSNTLTVSLVNGLQKTINITNVSCTENPGNYTGYPGSAGWNTSTSEAVSRGQSIEYSLVCVDEVGTPLAFDIGEGFSGRINVQYFFKDEGPECIRKISGNVYVRAG